MVTNNVTVYQFEVGLDEVFADKVRFRVNVDCVIVVVVKPSLSSPFSLPMSSPLCYKADFLALWSVFVIPSSHCLRHHLFVIKLTS